MAKTWQQGLCRVTNFIPGTSRRWSFVQWLKKKDSQGGGCVEKGNFRHRGQQVQSRRSMNRSPGLRDGRVVEGCRWKCQWRWLRSGRAPSGGHVEQRKFVRTAGAHKCLPCCWRNERKDFKPGRPLIRFVLNFSCLPLWGMVWKGWVRNRILTGFGDSVPQGTLGNVWKCCRLLQLGACYWHLGTHLRMKRTAPTPNPPNYPTPSADSAEVEKARSRMRISLAHRL